MSEFRFGVHSGDAPRYLRDTDPRPTINPTFDDFRVALEKRGETTIAAMLFDPISSRKAMS